MRQSVHPGLLALLNITGASCAKSEPTPTPAPALAQVLTATPTKGPTATSTSTPVPTPSPVTPNATRVPSSTLTPAPTATYTPTRTLAPETATAEGKIGSAPITVVLIFDTVSTGRDFTCAITNGGVAYCWGRGVEGQLGNGTRDDQSSPTRVLGSQTFTSLSAGDWHACGVTTQGTYCWGFGGQGLLGNGGVDNQSTPVPVSGGLTIYFSERWGKSYLRNQDSGAA